MLSKHITESFARFCNLHLSLILVHRVYKTHYHGKKKKMLALMSPSVPASAMSSASAFYSTGMLLSVSASILCYHFFQRHATDQWLGLNVCKAVVQLLSNASTSTSPTVLPKLIGLNRFLRVDKSIQQRFDFYLALFVTKFLGVHLLLACSAVP